MINLLPLMAATIKVYRLFQRFTSPTRAFRPWRSCYGGNVIVYGLKPRAESDKTIDLNLVSNRFNCEPAEACEGAHALAAGGGRASVERFQTEHIARVWECGLRGCARRSRPPSMPVAFDVSRSILHSGDGARELEGWASACSMQMARRQI